METLPIDPSRQQRKYACVQPIGIQVTVICGHGLYFCVDILLRNTHGVDVSGDSGSVVGEHHGCSPNHVDLSFNTVSGKPLA